MKDFINDLNDFISYNPQAGKIVKAYDKGYVTFSETLALILDDYNNSRFVYNVYYKTKGKGGRFKLFSEIEYEYTEINDVIDGLNNPDCNLTFTAKKKLKNA